MISLQADLGIEEVKIDYRACRTQKNAFKNARISEIHDGYMRGGVL